MKSKLLLTSLLLAGWGLSAAAQEPVTEQFECVADTWIRENNKGWKDGRESKTVEISTSDVKNDAGDVIGKSRFVALYAFNYSIPEGYKIKSATFHLITERYKGAEFVNVYGYDKDFKEDCNWDTEGSNIEKAIADSWSTAFTPAGHWSKAIFDDKIDENMRSLEAWTNNVDITEYVKSLGTNVSRVNLLLTQDASGQICFYTKNVKDPEKAFKISDDEYAEIFEPQALHPYLEVTFVEDTDSSTEALLPVADTQIRKGNATDNSKATAIEIKSTSGGDRFYGLMRFQLPTEVLDTENYEVTGASLRLVCTQNKGDRNMNIFDYSHDFAENTKYETEEEYVDEALDNEPIAEFEMAGFGTFSMGDNKKGNWADWTNAEAWTNNIDLTKYVVGKTAEGKTVFNILIAKAKEHNEAMKIATKEAVDITNAATEIEGIDAFTFKAEDLWPILTISYTKKPAPEFDLSYGNRENQEEGSDKGDYDIWVDSKNEDVTLYFKAPAGSKVFYSYTINEDNRSKKEAKRYAAPEENAYTEAQLSADQEGYHEIILPNRTAGTLKIYHQTNGVNTAPVSYSYKANYNEELAVEAIEATEAEAEYFNLQGVKVANPERGIYIRVAGGKASKIIL